MNCLEEDDGYGEEGGEAALDVAVDLGEVTEVDDTDCEELEVDGALLAAGLAGGGARGEVGQVCLVDTELQPERPGGHRIAWWTQNWSQEGKPYTR